MMYTSIRLARSQDIVFVRTFSLAWSSAMMAAMPTARAQRTPAVVNMRWLGVRYSSTRHLQHMQQQSYNCNNVEQHNTCPKEFQGGPGRLVSYPVLMRASSYTRFTIFYW